MKSPNVLNVPLIVSWPAGIKPQRCSGMIELVDVAPTLLQAAGLPAYAGMQGRSLWPLLTGASDARGRDNVYAEYYQAIPSGYQPDGAYATAVRTKLYAVSRVHRRDDGELYDLRKDPHEQHNLWRIPEMQAVKTEMLALLCDRMAETIDPLPPCRAGY